MMSNKDDCLKLIGTSWIIPAKARTWYAPLENPDLIFSVAAYLIQHPGDIPNRKILSPSWYLSESHSYAVNMFRLILLQHCYREPWSVEYSAPTEQWPGPISSKSAPQAQNLQAWHTFPHHWRSMLSVFDHPWRYCRIVRRHDWSGYGYPDITNHRKGMRNVHRLWCSMSHLQSSTIVVWNSLNRAPMQTTRFFPGFLLHEHLHDACSQT